MGEEEEEEEGELVFKRVRKQTEDEGGWMTPKRISDAAIHPLVFHCDVMGQINDASRHPSRGSDR